MGFHVDKCKEWLKEESQDITDKFYDLLSLNTKTTP